MEQRALAREALDALDHALGEVDADDIARSDELEWLHTRVCAVSACLDRLSAAGSVAA